MAQHKPSDFVALIQIKFYKIDIMELKASDMNLEYRGLVIYLGIE